MKKTIIAIVSIIAAAGIIYGASYFGSKNGQTTDENGAYHFGSASMVIVDKPNELHVHDPAEVIISGENLNMAVNVAELQQQITASNVQQQITASNVQQQVSATYFEQKVSATEAKVEIAATSADVKIAATEIGIVDIDAETIGEVQVSGKVIEVLKVPSDIPASKVEPSTPSAPSGYGGGGSPETTTKEPTRLPTEESVTTKKPDPVETEPPVTTQKPVTTTPAPSTTPAPETTTQKKSDVVINICDDNVAGAGEIFFTVEGDTSGLSSNANYTLITTIGDISYYSATIDPNSHGELVVNCGGTTEKITY